jgi:hypothetical protein
LRLHRLLSPQPGGLLQPSATPSATPSAKPSATPSAKPSATGRSVDRLAVPFTGKQAAKLAHLAAAAAEQVVALLGAQGPSGGPSVGGVSESASDGLHARGGGGGGGGGGGVGLVGSPLLPQLEALCGRRVAMLCAPPERLAAIEQVEACPILTLILA